MAKFLNTSGITYHLEEMIKKSNDRLILISPYLRFNDRLKELLADKNRLKIDIRLVYGKADLQPQEVTWLKELEYVRTSFCKNLHAKCYLNEETCIITSLNLYEFSQVNNNEMGVLISRDQDIELFRDAWDEAQRIIRISEEVRLSLERVATPASETENSETDAEPEENEERLTTSKLAQRLKLKTTELNDQLVAQGYLESRDGKFYLTARGKEAGGEFRISPRFGPYFLWPASFQPQA